MAPVELRERAVRELRRLSTAPGILWFAVTSTYTSSWFSQTEAEQAIGDNGEGFVCFVVLNREQKAKLQTQINHIMTDVRPFVETP